MRKLTAFLRGAVAMALRVTPALVALLLTPGPCMAQATSPAADGWKHTIIVYGLGAGMTGKVAVGNVGADVNLSFSDILNNLQAGGMLAYRGETGKWAVIANAVYMGLGATKDLRTGGSAESDIDESILEFDGSYRFARRWDVYFGLRGVHLGSTIEIRPQAGPTVSDNADKSWVDPLVGLRFEVPIGKSWSFIGKGDIGGFGISSNFAWQAMGHFDWRISKTFGLMFGYVALDMDYEDGSGGDFFRYDILSEGPFAGATFSF
jgi:hypothetical protein